MNGALLGLLELLGLVQSKQPSVKPALTSVSLGHLGTAMFPLSGPRAGLIDSEVPFPNPLRATIQGQVVVEVGVSDPPSFSSLTVSVHLDRVSNPDLIGAIDVILPVQADGQFSHQLTAFFRTDGPTPRRLEGVVSVRSGQGVLGSAVLPLELVDLEGFAQLVEKHERSKPAPSRLEFLASIRKVFLPASLFNALIGRHADVRQFFLSLPDHDRLTAYAHLSYGGERISIGHVLVGVEGAKRWDPQPRLPVPRVDLVVTWAGDLGSAIQEWAWETYYLALAHPRSLDEFTALLCSRADLLGDIDGVNLAASYDPARPLAVNLRRYYRQQSGQRFSAFLANTLKEEDGSNALSIEPSQPPRFTTSSREFIAQQVVDFATMALLQQLISDPRFPDKTFTPAPVRDLLRPQSPEVQRVAGLFVSLVEAGLAGELEIP